MVQRDPQGRLRAAWTAASSILRTVGAVAVIFISFAARAMSDELAEQVTLERHIWPILKAHCLDCHGADPTDIKGQLDLRQKRRMEQGGDSGPAIVPGDAEASLLLQRIRSGEMPPGDHQVPEDQQALLEAWIESGASTVRPEPESIPDGLAIQEEEREFWSFQPIRRPTVPRWSAELRARTPIDSLLLVPLQQAGLSFSEEADRRTWIRRVYLKVVGLPPTVAEVQAFLNDGRPGAHERVVDRLLASPAYGERWGRHWLDLAGFAESDGVTSDDRARPFAYRYRDYVIQAWNEDLPYDQFLVEQLAGDELVSQPYDRLQPIDIRRLEATGFLRMAPDGTTSENNDERRNQTIADTLKMVSTSLMGLSVGCAQCHDHRYDPISQRDYYRLRAVFEPAYDVKNWRVPDQRLISLASAEQRAQMAAIEAEVAKIAAERTEKERASIEVALEVELKRYPSELADELRVAYHTPIDQRSPRHSQLLMQHPSVQINGGNLYQYDAKAAEELRKYDAQMAEMRAKKPAEPFIAMLNEVPGNVPVTQLFYRGDYRQPREDVTPGPLSILAAHTQATFEPVAEQVTTSGRRLAFARWLTSRDHPLTARVFVNQIWLHHFGRGLVETPGDFGRLGQSPTHPELLDWLADELIRSGWSIKHLHRLILTSTVYRQSARASDSLLAADPANQFYGKWPVQRLEAEVVRDRVLACSGRLAHQIGGPSVNVAPDKHGLIVVEGDDRRRSIYLRVVRSQPVSLLAVFDQPQMETNCDRRTFATSPDQALMLMNGEFAIKHAEYLAERISSQAGDSTVRLIEGAWQSVYGREPDEAERHAAVNYFAQAKAGRFQENGGQAELARQQAVTDLCHVLLGSNEFLYVD